MPEEQINQSEQSQAPETSSYESRESSGVSFPTIGQQKKSGGTKMLLIIGILVLAAILGFVIYKGASKKSSEESPTPSDFDVLTTPSTDANVQTFSPAPSPSASPSKTDKSKVQIQIQNGTGITGEAAYLQTQLTGLGYSDIKVGNSDSNVTATSVTFSTRLDAATVSEITQKLNSIYQTVNSQTSSSQTFDVVIVTGLRKGASPKASASATPKASVTPLSSSTPTVKPTATP